MEINQEEKHIFQNLKILTELSGMAGFEDSVNEWLYKKWKPYVESLEYSGTRNLIAHFGGKGPKVLLEAHADEIGFLVKSIDESGFIRIVPSNPYLINPGRATFIVGLPAIIQTQKKLYVNGFFAAISGHAYPSALSDNGPLKWDDVFIDIGANNKEEVENRGIAIGDAIVWNPPTIRIGRHITGKAMDDRVGLLIMTEILPRLSIDELKYDLFLSSTIQEEMGLIGASSLEKITKLDLAICLDIVPSGDLPGIKMTDNPIRLGYGPVLIHHDTSVHYYRPLIQSLQKTAESKGIPIQQAVLSRYGSNGAELIRSGIPTALIGMPTRYTHSPFETIDQSDLIHCIDLLNCFLLGE